MSARRYSATDQLLIGLSRLLDDARQGRPDAPARPYPAQQTGAPDLDDSERRHAAGLMRVNHAGEIAAQALYQGQASTATNPETRDHLLAAAAEEQDHLRWCEQRLAELGEAPSRLRPLWYAGSYAMGALAGKAGDRWSLGFVAETERQVVAHLESHLQELPDADHRSREVVTAMRDDEARHGQDALNAGGERLPEPIPRLMKQTARLMTRLAYYF